MPTLVSVARLSPPIVPPSVTVPRYSGPSPKLLASAVATGEVRAVLNSSMRVPGRAKPDSTRLVPDTPADCSTGKFSSPLPPMAEVLSVRPSLSFRSLMVTRVGPEAGAPVLSLSPSASRLMPS